MKDKLAHFVINFVGVITCGAFGETGLGIGMIAFFIGSSWKEIDDMKKKRIPFNYGDWLADCLGIGLAGIIMLGVGSVR